MKPKRRSVSSTILGMFCLVSLASLLHADPVEEQVKEIRSRYNKIEGAKLPSRKMEFEAQDEPLYGSCTIFSRGDEVVKIHLSHGEGDHRASDEYFYYDSGELFFAYASDGSWRFTGTTLANGESETIDSVTEHRLYIAGGKVIRHLRKQASAKNPDHLASRLAEADNLPVEDMERASALLANGRAVYGVKTSADLGKLLSSPK